MLDVCHVGLLVVADDAAKGIGERLAGLLHLEGKEVRGPEREDQRALVVEHAATHEVALAARHVERGNAPAKANGNDVGVCDGRHVGRALLAGDLAVANAAVQVRHGKAQAAGNALSCHQGLVCLGAVGLSGLGGREVLD